MLAELPLPKVTDGRIVLAVDVSPWLRSDAPTSVERLFCSAADVGLATAITQRRPPRVHAGLIHHRWP
jgi:hypothetical protein